MLLGQRVAMLLGQRVAMLLGQRVAMLLGQRYERMGLQYCKVELIYYHVHIVQY